MCGPWDVTHAIPSRFVSFGGNTSVRHESSSRSKLAIDQIVFRECSQLQMSRADCHRKPRVLRYGKLSLWFKLAISQSLISFFVTKYFLSRAIFWQYREFEKCARLYACAFHYVRTNLGLDSYRVCVRLFTGWYMWLMLLRRWASVRLRLNCGGKRASFRVYAHNTQHFDACYTVSPSSGCISHDLQEVS